MSVQPSTNIKLLRDIPLDNSYTNTLWFDTTQDQLDYFNIHANQNGIKLTNQTYQRVNKNRARIDVNIGKIYDVNYMMFQNAGYSNKWFYAFILSVEYVNDSCTEIVFELDVFQTYMFDFMLGDCYVEREHVIDDSLGANTIEENLPVGEYIVQEVIDKKYGRGVIVTLATDTSNNKFYHGVYSGLYAMAYAEQNVGILNDALVPYRETPEQIASVIMCTDKMCGTGNSSGLPVDFSDTININRSLIINYDGESYIPKNNKLYCYPYYFFTVDNYSGNSETYRFEDFYDKLHATFNITGVPLPLPNMIAEPQNYKLTDGKSRNLYGVIYDNFPMCPYTIDTYRAWASQNIPKSLASTGANISNSIVNSATSLLTAGALTAITKNPAVGMEVAKIGVASNIASGAINTGLNMFNLGIDNEYHKLHSTSVGGTQSSGLNFAQGNIGFRGTIFTIRPEYAKIIDEFFTRFGYKVNRVEVPLLHSRKSFNYIKTASCMIKGAIPITDKDKLMQIFNNGVTLWHDTENVGNYGVDNSIIV